MREKPRRASAIFGMRLREERNRRGISLAKLSATMGDGGHPVSHASILRLEHGQRDVGLDEAIALAGVFGVPLTAWLTDGYAEATVEQEAIRIYYTSSLPIVFDTLKAES
jgi:transcriptional regulator with XRE-family HTH domain